MLLLGTSVVFDELADTVKLVAGVSASLTVNAMAPVAVLALTARLAIALMVGGAFSTIVPMPTPSPIATLTGAVRLTTKISVGSETASTVIGTDIVFRISPGAKVTGPANDV